MELRLVAGKVWHQTSTTLALGSPQVSIHLRRPEKQRWDRKMLTEMNGEPWNPVPAKHMAPQVRGVCITVERRIKHGGTKGEDVTQATPPVKASRIIVSQAATKINAKGQHDCLIARHDIRVAFSMRWGAGES